MIRSNIPKLLPIGTRLPCADTSGAKEFQIIGYVGYQGTKKRRLTGGAGSVAVVVVKKGKLALKRKKHFALIIRQKYPISRKIGQFIGKIAFEDNAAIMLDPVGYKTLNYKISGPIAKQVAYNKKYSELKGVYR